MLILTILMISLYAYILDMPTNIQKSKKVTKEEMQA